MKTNFRPEPGLLIVRFLATASIFFVLIATLVTFIGASSRSLANSTTGKAPTADALLQQVSAKLHKASTYHAEFTATELYPKAIKDVEQRGTVSLAKPKKWRIEIERFRRTSRNAAWGASGNNTLSVSDSKTHSFEFIHPHSAQYRKQPLSNAVTRTALADVAPLESFFSPSGASLKTTGAAKFLKSTTWQGRSYRVVFVPVAAQLPATTSAAQIFIGDDLLIHRLLLQSNTPKGVTKKEWQFRNIRLGKPLPSSTFVFKAQSDAEPFSSSVKGSKLLPIGSVAPDFIVRDSTGNPVRLKDYRGKTVVLDFWASWCWACNKSLPSTAALARKYRNRNVVVLAIVIWDTPKSFKSWLSKHHYPEIDFAIDAKPQGQDIATKLYHVSVRPTAYVIDTQGKIRGTSEGYEGNSTDLENALRVALQ